MRKRWRRIYIWINDMPERACVRNVARHYPPKFPIYGCWVGKSRHVLGPSGRMSRETNKRLQTHVRKRHKAENPSWF